MLDDLCSYLLSALAAALAMSATTAVFAQDVINIYGRGGPAPAMQEAANRFGAMHKVTVNVVAGPTSKWVDKA